MAVDKVGQYAQGVPVTRGNRTSVEGLGLGGVATPRVDHAGTGQPARIALFDGTLMPCQCLVVITPICKQNAQVVHRTDIVGLRGVSIQILGLRRPSHSPQRHPFGSPQRIRTSQEVMLRSIRAACLLR
jgi:hypothetical protein